MPILDFKEIPEAHIANGQQDTFELLCQQILSFLGLEIESVPDRGQDGGKDLICIERREGIVGSTNVRWLVSCKHKAHSGSSVGVGDEESITDRLRQHNAEGFIGFYSTVVSSGLNQRLNSYKNSFYIKIFNNEEIEAILLGNEVGEKIAARFFPHSYKKWKEERNEPANIFDEYEPLHCNVCGRDILSEDEESKGGIVAFVYDLNFYDENGYGTDRYVDIYFACKGRCDRILQHEYKKQGQFTHWKDIGDLKISTEYLKWNMAILNNLYKGTTIFEEKAYAKLKKALMSTAQTVLRRQSEKELKRLKSLSMIPPWL